MSTAIAIAKLVAAFGSVVSAHALLPEPYGTILGAVIAAAAVLAKSPLDARVN